MKCNSLLCTLNRELVVLFTECHSSCTTCTGATNKDCEECRDGWEEDEEETCVGEKYFYDADILILLLYSNLLAFILTFPFQASVSIYVYLFKKNRGVDVKIYHQLIICLFFFCRFAFLYLLFQTLTSAPKILHHAKTRNTALTRMARIPAMVSNYVFSECFLWTEMHWALSVSCSIYEF